MPKKECKKNEWCLHRAAITITTNSHQEKIVTLNECKRMEPVAINQGPCLTQQLTLTIVFFSFGALFAHTKSSQKENTNTLK